MKFRIGEDVERIDTDYMGTVVGGVYRITALDKVYGELKLEGFSNWFNIDNFKKVGKQAEEFSLVCRECNTEVLLKNRDYLGIIRISGSIDFSSDITITCQNCGNSIHLK